MNLRAIVIGVMIAAGALGVLARVGTTTSTPVAPVQLERATPALRLDKMTRPAIIDGIVTEPVTGARIRLADCDHDIAAFTFPINMVAGPDLVEKTFAAPGYKVVDVYRSQTRDAFSNFERVLATISARLATVRSGFEPVDRYFVRIAIPSSCRIDNDNAVELATALIAGFPKQ